MPNRSVTLIRFGSAVVGQGMDVQLVAISYGADRSEICLRVCKNDGSTAHEEVIFSPPGQEVAAISRWAYTLDLQEKP